MAKGIAGDLTKWFKKLDRTLGSGSGGASGPAMMRFIGEKCIEIIVRRTRLGYSVSETGARRERFAPFKPSYRKFRKDHPEILGEYTTAGRRNLTLTGQMLSGMRVIKAVAKTVLIGSTGRRTDGQDNADIARWVSLGKYRGGVPRPFNFLSDKELLQIKRIWRKAFGDLKNRFR